MVTGLFLLFAGLAIACALSLVYHRNPLYSAVSLVGVLISLACIYVTLAAPFIAAVQVLVYAGAIMVLVVFVIMLLNLEDDKPRYRLNYLYTIGGFLGVVLLGQTFFIFYAVLKTPNKQPIAETNVGMTINIGRAMYTEYLLPVEVVGILLLMAIIGAIMMSRKLNQPQMELVKAQEELNEMVERNDY